MRASPFSPIYKNNIGRIVNYKRNQRIALNDYNNVTEVCQLSTKTDGSDMCCRFFNFEGGNHVHHEVYNILPVVDAFGIRFPYAARTVNYQCNVQQTSCNMLQCEMVTNQVHDHISQQTQSTWGFPCQEIGSKPLLILCQVYHRLLSIFPHYHHSEILYTKLLSVYIRNISSSQLCCLVLYTL